ncbi:hypothetical protein [Saccharibacillus alkalitolerans]|uniref:DUF2092 domain-containing protein n=1 Tax=Saccharibacillus alkalitolerans TaxID=2705290 RepID=A0ABX0FD83_9BACL|nr:hypothetical protein [Saccharibacillus alkalitolerans]NGZ77609.1 hypothetical protein [Saccharibacillus alkalitolerans]
MKKSVRTKTIGIMAAGMIVTASLGAAAYANGNAYENFRSAALKTMEIDNSTLTSEIAVRQNGAVTASGRLEIQSAGEEIYSSGQLEIGGKTLDVEQATENGKMILRKGDRYYSVDAPNAADREDKDFEASPSALRLAEAASDLLLGDIKNRFTESGDTITLNLTDAQIPELANLAMNAMLEAGAKHGEDRLSEETQWQAEWDGFDHAALFPIASDGRVESVRLEAAVKDGAISTIKTTVGVSGLDEKGQKIELEASVDSAFSKVGSTVPQDIDVTGKTVEKLELPADADGRGPFGHGRTE